MNIQKANWNNSESRLNLSFPITKIDREKRTVSGFASLDNLDRHGDVVTAEASKKAFERFRGNIREMHSPSAVGKMLNFKEDSYFDKDRELMKKIEMENNSKLEDIAMDLMKSV